MSHLIPYTYILYVYYYLIGICNSGGFEGQTEETLVCEIAGELASNCCTSH